MDRYWDFTPKQRSELTGDQVRALLAVELMERGVLVVAPPAVMPVPEAPAMQTRTWYAVEYRETKYSTTERVPFVFATVEQAHAFTTLQPMKLEHDWETGGRYQYEAPITGMGVVKIELYQASDIASLRSTLKEIKAAQDQNEKANAEYRTACAKTDEATKGVWEDWNTCRSDASNYRRVIDTLTEYRKLAGNEDVALGFLLKAFTRDHVVNAFEWFELPIPEKLQAAPADV